MRPNFDDFEARQKRIIESSGVPQSVVSAMDSWAKWMQHGAVGRGYSTHAVGFASGGINCYDDMQEEAENYAARTVDGAVNSLDHTSRTCIGIVWLGHSIYYRRINVEEKAQEAMRVIWRRLQVFGIA